MDDATLLNSDEEIRPQPGDIALCINCCHVMAYADDMTLRDLTEMEIAELKTGGQWRQIELTQYNLASAKQVAAQKWN
jgi:hypothetical protein